MRASEIIGRRVHDDQGRYIGRVADLVTDDDHRVVEAMVVRGPWGRLLGYERDEATGPWVLEQLARYVLRRNSTAIPWGELRFGSPGAPEG
jgi:sporulation protein YlmC with PRC-barrel domain